MLRARCRHSLATLAAAAVLGTWALVAPAQAQSTRRAGSQILLTTMEAVRLPQGSGVFYAQLPECRVYLVGDSHSARLASIILSPVAEQGESSPDELRQLAERFQRAYKLSGYSITLAEDASAVLLLREEKPYRDNSPQALRALADRQSLAPAIRWLNERCGGAPCGMVGTQLRWSRIITQGNNSRELHIALDILQGAPGCVDIRLNNVALPKVADLLSQQLGLELDAVSGDKAGALRRRIGLKPLGFMEEKSSRRGQQSQAGICLVRVAGENGLYRLAETATLQKLNERSAKDSPAKLPEVPEATWADESAGTPQPATTRAAAPASPRSAEAPAQGELQGLDEDVDPTAEGNTPAPVASPAAPAAAGDPPAMPAPAEARKAYAEQLKAL